MIGACMLAVIAVTQFGTTKFGEQASLYTLEGKDGLKLVVSDFGCRLVECWAPDRDGKPADVTLGFRSVGEYETNGFCVGMIVGRFGNRIRDGRFTLDGKEIVLPVNECTPTRHCNLHGGPDGWDSKVWKAKPLKRGDTVGIEFSLVSPDGDMGFPGEVHAKVRYLVLPGNVWRLEYEATTDRPTVINLTQHSYFNLAGEASGDVRDQQLRIFADEYTLTDTGLIPLRNVPVKGTGFDFTELTTIRSKVDWMSKCAALKCTDNWYDHNFVLRGKIGELHPAVVMRDPASGRVLEIWTDQPGLQMYGAQNFTAALKSKTPGKPLGPYAGIVFETQHFPDSPNHPEFPSTVLRPGETYRTVTEYRFKAR